MPWSIRFTHHHLGAIEVHNISGHQLYLLHDPENQHVLFRTCAICNQPELLEETFMFDEGRASCNSCYNQLVDARFETIDSFVQERQEEYCTWLEELNPPSVTGTMRKAVFKRDGSACRYCGATTNLSIDQILPQSRGGNHALTNLACCCSSCNSKKHARTPEEAGMTLRPLMDRP